MKYFPLIVTPAPNDELSAVRQQEAEYSADLRDFRKSVRSGTASAIVRWHTEQLEQKVRELRSRIASLTGGEPSLV